MKRPLAKTIMVFMVKGLLTPLRFPYAQFPCSTLTGDFLVHPFWQAVFRLKRMDFKENVCVAYQCIPVCALITYKVLGATFDGGLDKQAPSQAT